MKVELKQSIAMWSSADYIVGRLSDARRDVFRSYQKVTVHQANELRECYREPCIIGGYRKNYSVAQVVFSLFQINNELLNFWTHFLPTFYFAWKFMSLSSTMPLFSDPYMFPLACHMIASCCYPLASCLAHAFSCMSPLASHVCFFLDYAAISLYSFGAAVIYYAYVFPESFLDTWYSAIFLPVASINTLLATFLACYSRFPQPNSLTMILRLCAFIWPFIWDSIPLIYRLVTCNPERDTCADSMPHHLAQFVAVGAACFFYASRIPERFSPGSFDVVGNSHNLLHVFGIVATNEQLRAIILDLTGRRASLKEIDWVVDPTWTTVVTPALLVLCLAIIIVSVTLLDQVEPFCVDGFSCCRPSRVELKKKNNSCTEKKTQ